MIKQLLVFALCAVLSTALLPNHAGGAKVSDSYVEWATGYNNGRKLAVDINDTVHMVFQYKFNRAAPNGLYLCHAWGDGSSWHQEGIYDAYYPSVAAHPTANAIAVILVRCSHQEQPFWTGELVQVWRRGTYGIWTLEDQPDIRSGYDNFFYPSITYSPDGYWHAAWVSVQNGVYRLIYKRKNAPKSDTIEFRTYPDIIRFPSITYDAEGCVDIVYERTLGQSPQLNHARLENGSWHFYLPTIWSSQYHPCSDLNVFDSRLHAVWEDNWQRNDIAHNYWTDDPYWGWGHSIYPIHVAATAAPSVYPSIDDGHVLWSEHQVPKKWILWSKFRYESDTWSEPMLVSSKLFDSEYPQACYQYLPYVLNDYLHLIYTRKTPNGPAPYEIVYRRLNVVPEEPVIDEDLGQEQASQYTQSRTGWISYGDLPCLDVDYGDSDLVYLVPGLDSSQTYWLEMSYYHESQDSLVQYLLVDGETLSVSTIKPYEPEYVAVELPTEVTADGEIQAEVLKDQGEFAVAGIMRLYTEGGGERKNGKNTGPQTAVTNALLSPESFSVACSPNPSGGAAIVSVQVPLEGTVSVGVYDLSGRLVRGLANGSFAAGVHCFQWDGNGASGERLPSGVYFCQASWAQEVTVAKMVIAR